MNRAGGAPFAFVGSDPCLAALDRADELRADDAALTALWPQGRLVVLDADGRAYADEDGHLLPLTGRALGGGVGASVFLGLDRDGHGWFALESALIATDAPARADLRTAAATWPALEAGAFASARALQHWRARHRFCGACGGEVAFARGGWLGRCEGCGLEHYPRTDPAVIAAIGDGGDHLLMGRQASWPKGRYSVLAGFVEPGETLEQAVVREVREETGVRVLRCRYMGSQPWPMPGSLMIGFVGEAEPGEVRVTDELEDARWFHRDELRAALDAEARGEPGNAGFQLPSSISIAHWLVRKWLAARP